MLERHTHVLTNLEYLRHRTLLMGKSRTQHYKQETYEIDWIYSILSMRTPLYKNGNSWHISKTLPQWVFSTEVYSTRFKIWNKARRDGELLHCSPVRGYGDVWVKPLFGEQFWIHTLQAHQCPPNQEECKHSIYRLQFNGWLRHSHYTSQSHG